MAVKQLFLDQSYSIPEDWGTIFPRGFHPTILSTILYSTITIIIHLL